MKIGQVGKENSESIKPRAVGNNGQNSEEIEWEHDLGYIADFQLEWQVQDPDADRKSEKKVRKRTVDFQ